MNSTGGPDSLPPKPGTAEHASPVGHPQNNEQQQETAKSMGHSIKAIPPEDVNLAKGLRAEGAYSEVSTKKLSERSISHRKASSAWQTFVKSVKKLLRMDTHPLTTVSIKDLGDSFRTHQSSIAEAGAGAQLFDARHRHILPPAIPEHSKNIPTSRFADLFLGPEADNQIVEIRGVDFTGSRFDAKNLKGIRFVDCKFDRADLSGCQLTNTCFSNCSFHRANMKGVQGGDTQFLSCQMDRTDFSHARLTTPTLLEGEEGVTRHCNFSDAQITGGTVPQLVNSTNSFIRAKLTDLKLDRLHVSDELSGATLIDVDAKKFSRTQPFRISGLTVERGNFHFGSEPEAYTLGVGGKLYNCSFTGTRILSVNSRTNMYGVTFSSVDMTGQKFSYCDWEGVKFIGTPHMEGMELRHLVLKHCLPDLSVYKRK